MTDNRTRASHSEKKKDAIFRLKDGTDRLVFKVKDSECSKAMVSKIKDKTIYLCDPNVAKFRSTNKQSGGFKLAPPLQHSLGMVSTHQESSVADKTSREGKKCDFTIRKNNNSLRFKTHEVSAAAKPLALKLNIVDGLKDSRLKDMRARLNEANKLSTFDETNLRASLRPPRVERRPVHNTLSFVAVDPQFQTTAEPSSVSRKPEVRNFSVVPRRAKDQSRSSSRDKPVSRDRLQEDPLQNVLVPNSKFIDSLDEYEILQKLGKGAYAKVYLVRSRINGKEYALKTYPKKEYLTKPQRFINIRNEVEIMCKMEHPSIIKVYHVCESPEKIHLIMEKGYFASLDEFLELMGDDRLSEAQAAQIFKNICLGMLYLHKQGICHRDIKLGNILIDSRDNSVKIIDFGFATVSGNSDLTNYCGTPSYMCPELLKRESYLGWQADVWALGIVLYRLACGCRPFHGKGDDLKQNIVKGEYSIPSFVSSSLRALLECMLQYQGRNRPSVREVLSSKWLQCHV